MVSLKILVLKAVMVLTCFKAHQQAHLPLFKSWKYCTRFYDIFRHFLPTKVQPSLICIQSPSFTLFYFWLFIAKSGLKISLEVTFSLKMIILLTSSLHQIRHSYKLKIKKSRWLFFKKWANLGLFFVYFQYFQTNNTFLQQFNVKTCPTSIRRRDLNPWPFKHELSPITTWPENC